MQAYGAGFGQRIQPVAVNAGDAGGRQNADFVNIKLAQKIGGPAQFGQGV